MSLSFNVAYGVGVPLGPFLDQISNKSGDYLCGWGSSATGTGKKRAGWMCLSCRWFAAHISFGGEGHFLSFWGWWLRNFQTLVNAFGEWFWERVGNFNIEEVCKNLDPRICWLLYLLSPHFRYYLFDERRTHLTAEAWARFRHHNKLHDHGKGISYFKCRMWV